MYTRLSATFAALVLGATASLFTATPALADPEGLAATVGCGSPCDGKDSETYVATVGGVRKKCSDDAVTVKEAHITQLRYSAFCRTAWARSTSPGYLGFSKIESYNSSGLRKVYKEFDTHNWTPMVNDKGYSARGCHWQWDDEDQAGPPHMTGCTAKY